MTAISDFRTDILARDAARQAIAQQTEEFLRRGGRIDTGNGDYRRVSTVPSRFALNRGRYGQLLSRIPEGAEQEMREREPSSTIGPAELGALFGHSRSWVWQTNINLPEPHVKGGGGQPSRWLVRDVVAFVDRIRRASCE